MNEKYESGGFVTRYSSSPYDMIECKHIRITLWEDYPSLTSDNFNDVFIKISSNSLKYKFWDSYRSEYGNDVPFKFPPEDCDDPIKFNVIFYMKEDGTVAGYTQFLEAQSTSTISELFIYTHFKYNTEISDLILKNDLEAHIYENFLNNLDVKKSMEDTRYATRLNIDSTYVSTFQRFTNHVPHVASDDRYVISTNSLTYLLGTGYKLNIRNVYVPHPNITIGIYQGDLVVCSWRDYLYDIRSLTKVTEDGKDLVYFEGNIRLTSTAGGYGLKDYSISRVTPYCVVCHVTVMPEQETALICLEDDIVRAKDSYHTFINDPYSIRYGCIVNSSVMDTSLRFIDRVESPEMYRKVVSSVYNGNIPGRLVRVEGSFSVFKVGEEYHYSNLEGIVISNKPDLMVFNDCCLLDQDEDNLYFYFTYNNSKVNTNGLTEDKYKYLIHQLDKSEGLTSQLFSSIRKNMITYSKLPNISAAFGGLLFYKDENRYLKFV